MSNDTDGPFRPRSGVATQAATVAFVAFLVTDFLWGNSTAVIVFFSTFGGLVVVLPLYEVAIRQARSCREDRIMRTASLAADLAIKSMTTTAESSKQTGRYDG